MNDIERHEAIDVLVSRHQPESVTLSGYIIGFSSSLVLTLSAYFIASYHLLTKPLMIALLAVLALMQFVVQLIYFLHVGKEFSPRLKLIVMLFMIVIVFIIAGGSIWIMNNIDNRMMGTKQMVHYMQNQDNL